MYITEPQDTTAFPQFRYSENKGVQIDQETNFNIW